MSHPLSNQPVTCLRSFRVRVRPGQEEAYTRYVAEVVEPIDRIAHAADVFVDVLAIQPEPSTDGSAADQDWTHCRLFSFRDRGQRDRFQTEMGKAAAQFDGSDAALAKRKAYAETLREALGPRDYSVHSSS